MYMKMALVPKGIRAIHLSYGAGDGNRTRVMSLEGSGSTIEPHPRFARRSLYRKFVACARDSRAQKGRSLRLQRLWSLSKRAVPASKGTRERTYSNVAGSMHVFLADDLERSALSLSVQVIVAPVS